MVRSPQSGHRQWGSVWCGVVVTWHLVWCPWLHYCSDEIIGSYPSHSPKQCAPAPPHPALDRDTIGCSKPQHPAVLESPQETGRFLFGCFVSASIFSTTNYSALTLPPSPHLLDCFFWREIHQFLPLVPSPCQQLLVKIPMIKVFFIHNPHRATEKNQNECCISQQLVCNSLTASKHLAAAEDGQHGCSKFKHISKQVFFFSWSINLLFGYCPALNTLPATPPYCKILVVKSHK